MVVVSLFFSEEHGLESFEPCRNRFLRAIFRKSVHRPLGIIGCIFCRICFAAVDKDLCPKYTQLCIEALGMAENNG